jgi:predicted nucleic acid-binding protein
MISGPIVSNSSPLIALEQIGQLRLIEYLFNSVFVPPGVVSEVSSILSLPGWIVKQDLSQAVGPIILSASLGQGESETISLALEMKARLLILDDRPARRLARTLDFPIIGTLGILSAAKHANFLPVVRPSLNALMQHNFRIAPMLLKQVLRDLGEE